MNLNRDPQQPAPHAVSIHAVAPNPTVLAGNNIPQGDRLAGIRDENLTGMAVSSLAGG
jgi:hypothetical protein